MIVSLDYETFYSKEYSLSKMSEAAYIMDDRFQTIMCAVKEGAGPNELFIGEEAVRERLSRIDWTKAAVLSHNMRFDGAILAWRYGIVPALYLDTLSMARALTHSQIGRSSLKAVAAYLGLGEKGSEVVNAIGLRLEDFPPQQLREYGGYCLNDNDLCLAIFQAFMRVFPKSELAVVDAVIRMYVQPQVTLDSDVLAAHLADVEAQHRALFERVNGIDKSVFSSSARFKALLEEWGVECPMKVSPATGELIPALAKNDREFKELCEDHEQPIEVQALLAARVGAKSTIEGTRTQAFLKLSLLEWGPNNPKAQCPVPLKYYGAHTGRLSGDGGFNFQNMKRGSKLKRAIKAPPGYRVLHRDASQIEARMVAFLAGCGILLDAFARGDDVYSIFASKVYGRTITKADKGERFVGKTSILGLGYQTGAEKLRHTLFIGNGGMSVKVDIHQAREIVRLYRSEYREIPSLWGTGDQTLSNMIAKNQGVGPVNITFNTSNAKYPVVEAGPDALWLPNGMCIAYRNLREQTTANPNGPGMVKQKVYDGPYGPRSIYGGKLTENVSQALSRIVITDIIRRAKVETGYTPFLSTHDSLDYCVPVGDALWWDNYLDQQFAIRPTWAPDLPLASEGGWGVSLHDAEEGHNE